MRQRGLDGASQIRIKQGRTSARREKAEWWPMWSKVGAASQQPGASTAARQQGVENSFRSHKAMSPSNEPARKDPSSQINQIDQSAKSVARVAEVTGHTVTQPEETKKKKQTKACAASRQNSRGCSRKRRRRRRGGKSRRVRARWCQSPSQKKRVRMRRRIMKSGKPPHTRSQLETMITMVDRKHRQRCMYRR